MTEITDASAKAIAQAIHEKRVSAVEVVQAHLTRIAEVNDKLNAIVHLCADRAMQEARKADAALTRGDATGPLHGVPMTLKDSLDTEGVITTAGTIGRRDFIPNRDATITDRLRAAGAILLGKTNTPEITWSGETDNDIYGRTNNPFDLERNPGGSSGGAAAIVSACGSPFDIGSDTGGSIRAPAHLCGIAGIKPNSGRVPRTGHIIGYTMGAIDSYTQNGPMARYVEDLALILPIISGPDWKDPYIVDMPLGDPTDVDLSNLRVAFYTDPPGFTLPDEDTRSAALSAVNALTNIVASIQEDIPQPLSRVPDLNDRSSEGDGGAGTRRLLDRIGATDISSRLAKWLDEAELIPTEEFTKTLEDLDRYRSEMLQFMRDYDVIISPTTATAAQPHGEYSKQRGYAIYTHPYNLTGWPTAVVRCGTSYQGLPIGVQIITRPWREDVALAVAAFLESALGGWQKPPI